MRIHEIFVGFSVALHISVSASPDLLVHPVPTVARQQPYLRQQNSSQIRHVAASVHQSQRQPACSCKASDPSWSKPVRFQPKCLFIDLGAADGNSFNTFLTGGYKPLSSCPGNTYEAYLVEANPRFKSALKNIESSQVHTFAPEAAYMCNGQTSFYIDTVNHDKNYWGSSMSSKHHDVQRSGQVSVTVPTVNVIQLVAENAIPADHVIVKMDIEGAEYDIMPCLADSPYASLIDELLVEIHSADWGTQGTTPYEMEGALNKLRSKGVRIPQYNSPTL